ncbi:MAG: SH3 domain-containing protein [Spirochaetes bacterium]|nr:SH3 domain-containing protein [Spirochaetota bacterium]
MYAFKISAIAFIIFASAAVNAGDNSKSDRMKFRVKPSVLNVRSEPAYNSSVIGQISQGVEISGSFTFIYEYISNIDSAGMWIKFRFKDNTDGYVFDKYLEMLNEKEDFPDYSSLYFILGNGVIHKYNSDDSGSTVSGVLFSATLNSFVIAQTWGGEGWIYHCINRETGSSADLWNMNIKFSPDKKRFLIVSVDIDAGFDPTGFQIFSFSRNRFNHEYFIDCGNVAPGTGEAENNDENFVETIGDAGWFPENVYWISNTEIHFDAKSSANGKYTILPMRIKIVNGKWVLLKR